MMILQLIFLFFLFEIMKQTTAQFDFVAKPKVTAVRPKYRERQQDTGEALNLMNDPRVVRGNTYAAIVTNKNQIQPPPLPKKNLKETKKATKGKAINFDTGFEATTPRAVHNRDHFSTQTQAFVQTLRDKPIQYEKECQSDFFLDRPVERQFDPMKGKSGTDRHTQVDENDPELFNFNYEVQPIIEALMSKVLQSSRMQLYEEQQLALKEKEKIDYEKRRYAKLAQAHKLQANETRLKEQYDRRQLQYQSSKEQETYAQKKLISRILSKQYLKNIKNNTYMILSEQGFFRQPLQTGLYEQFVPWLYQQILEELNLQTKFTETIDSAIKQGNNQRLSQSNAHIQSQMKRRSDIISEKNRIKEQKRKQKQQKLRIQREQQQKIKAQEQNNQQNP